MGFFSDDEDKGFDNLEAGDKVIATEDIGGGIFGCEVDKGTQGVISEVDGGGLFGGRTLTVHFQNGATVDCDPSSGLQYLHS